MIIKMSRLKYIIIGLILIAGFAVGAELQSFYLSKFGGLNNSVNIRLLQDFEASDLSNFSLDEIGSIKERDVFGQYNSLSGNLGSNFITGLFKFYTATSKYFIACAGSNVATGSGGAFSTSITPSTNTVTSGKYWSGVSFNNFFYMFNPSVPMQYYQGTGGLNSPASTPGTNCSYSAVHKSRVWAARSDSLPYRLYWSSLNNGNDWATTGGYADLPDITQEITGIVSWGGYLYVFTETNIYVLLGSTPNDFSLRKTNSMVGAIAPRSIKVTDIGICFLSRSGVYAFDGNNSNKASVKIESTISGISKTQIQNACAVYDGRKYWLSYTPQGSNYNDKIIIYDTLLKDWTVYQGSACNISYFERAYGGTDRGELYGGSSTSNGIVYQLQTAQGTESIVYNTRTSFLNGTTFNTVVGATETNPQVRLVMGEHAKDTNTKLLLHFNGTDAATSTSDESDSNHNITFVGGAQLDTTDKMFGSASLQNIVATGQGNLTIPNSSDFDIFASTTDNWTLAFWVEHDSVGDVEYYFIHHQDNANKWSLSKNAANAVAFTSVEAGVTEITNTGGNIGTANQWYHVALIKVGTEYGVYINGQQVSYNSDNDTNNVNGILYIGQNAEFTFYLYGHMDEIILQKSNIYNAVPNASNTNVIDYNKYRFGGSLTSSNIQINSAGQSTLGNIEWLETLDSGTDVQLTTRTGTTNDSVDFNSWQAWASTSTVVNPVTTNSVWSTSGDITVIAPASPQARNILFYETDDSASPNCVQIGVSGAISKNDYIETSQLTQKDLSNYEWIGFWLKSPTTGNSVAIGIGENYTNTHLVTAGTVIPNVWEYHYGNINGVASANKDAIGRMRVTYLGDGSGTIYLGDITAYSFFDSDDIISSTPNDWIQYKAIFGSTISHNTARLNSLTLTYAPALSVSESALSSYYYTKWFDFKTPQLNKQFDSLVLECNSTTFNTVTANAVRVYCDYDIDFGTKTGTLSFPIMSTNNTVRILKNFPSSTYGKAMRLKIYNNNKDAQVTVKGTEIRYRQEQVQPN